MTPELRAGMLIDEGYIAGWIAPHGIDFPEDFAQAIANVIKAAEREARARAMEDAAKAYQDAAGRVALLVALLREYQGFNRIHDDSEADIYARGGALLTMPPVPITLARALASSGSGGSGP